MWNIAIFRFSGSRCTGESWQRHHLLAASRRPWCGRRPKTKTIQHNYWKNVRTFVFCSYYFRFATTTFFVNTEPGVGGMASGSSSRMDPLIDLSNSWTVLELSIQERYYLRQKLTKRHNIRFQKHDPNKNNVPGMGSVSSSKSKMRSLTASISGVDANSWTNFFHSFFCSRSFWFWFYKQDWWFKLQRNIRNDFLFLN